MLYNVLSTRWARYALVGIVLVLTQVLDQHVAYYCLRGKWDAAVPPFADTGWKNATRIVRERAPELCRIFVRPILIERKLLDTDSSPLLREFLLTTVNSVYRLSDDQLARTEPFNEFDSLEKRAAALIKKTGVVILVHFELKQQAEQTAAKLRNSLPAGGVVETWTEPDAAIAVIYVGAPTKAATIPQ
jgi:hypothetical protein